jgi:hypothetical protein
MPPAPRADWISKGPRRVPADTGIRRGYGEAPKRGIYGFVNPVCRGPQQRRDSRSLRIEQDRIFGRRREHASFFEADDEDMRTASVAGVCQRAGVDVTGPWTLGGDMQRLHAFADEAQRPRQRTREGCESAQLSNTIDKRRCRSMVKGALPCRRVLDKPASGFDDGLQRDEAVWRRFGNRSHEGGDPVEDA